MRLDNLKILVTGGRGYVGSHTAISLRKAGAEVYVVDNRFVKQNKVEGTHFYMADYASETFLANMKEIGIDGIVHCAGTSLVGPSVKNPSEYYNNNVLKTVKMLDHIKEWDTKPFVVFSSSAAVYGNPTQIPITIFEPMNPVNPYGKTKMMIEHILEDYDAAYGIRSYSFRYFNAAGADVWDSKLGPEPGDTHLIPRIFEAYQQGKAFHLYGNDYDTEDGTCVRDYIHVCDLALAHLSACVDLSDGATSAVFNLGTSHGYSNQEIIDAFKEQVGDIEVQTEPRREGDPDTLVADASLFYGTSGPKFSDMRTIIDSFKKYYDKMAATEFKKQSLIAARETLTDFDDISPFKEDLIKIDQQLSEIENNSDCTK